LNGTAREKSKRLPAHRPESSRSWRTLRKLKHLTDDARHIRWIARNVAPFPAEAIVPLDRADNVLLLCSRIAADFDVKVRLQELAFAHELAARNRKFAVTDAPQVIFDKSVVWFLPNSFVSPPLWDYSRQAREFATGLERQGNRLLCSSAEVALWENKATMHAKFREAAVPTPATTILSEETWGDAEFDIEPVLLKEEHSAGSEGIHYFATAREARDFVQRYRFRPSENLIMQELVRGATRDLRVTMVGDRMIPSATFWRRKSREALAGPTWTTTASKYGSTIEHRDVPESVGPVVAGYLRALELRVAGVDLMWVDDDFSRPPLVLEVSPYFQPNPPKPERYAKATYKEYKARPYAKEGYLLQQYGVFREMAAQVLDQRLF
jgi:glutathione synthase/RimK-type ligase-like ATP-grasp enzyme